MDGRDSTDESRQDSIDTNQHLGTSVERTGSVAATLATVERPELVEDGATVDVTGYAYDDEAGTVEVRVDVGRETIHLTFGPDEATALADHLALAAIHALGVDDDGA
jgi:hypothetical protein